MNAGDGFDGRSRPGRDHVDEREYSRRLAAERFAYPRLALRAARANAGRFLLGEERTLSYGDDSNQRLVLMTPRAGADRGRAPVVFVHGGSWASGSPERYRFVGRWLASTGRPAAVVGYRHAPESVFPAQLDDAADGVRATLEALDGAGCATGSVVIAGQSAGGHLAALAAFSPVSRARSLGAEESRTIAGTLLISAPLDLGVVCPDKRLCPVVRRLMGGWDGWDAADPVRFVSGDEGFDTLVLHGSLDPVVTSAASASFVERIEGAGGTASLVLAENAYHANLMGIFLDSRPEADTVRRWLSRLDMTAPA